MKRNAIRMLCVCLAAVFLAGGSAAMKLPKPVVTDPDPRTDRMCAETAAPEKAKDKIHIRCGLEYGTFAPDTKAAPPGDRELLVVAYNMERGMKFDRQLALLKDDPELGEPDIMLVSEADRGCSRSGYRNVVRDLAKALGMNYVYGVEYVELPRKNDSPVNAIDAACEHGNAVLSRYPIRGAEEIRHANTTGWYIEPGPKRDNAQPRLGGNMAIAADLDIAGSPLRVYALHLDSGIENNDMRGGQVREALDHAKGVSDPIVMGGDLNTISFLSDLQSRGRTDRATAEFLNAGYTDAHAGLSPLKRGTVNRSYPVPVVIDLIFLRGPEVQSRGVCPIKKCNDLSDHLPVWARIKIKAPLKK